jgi:hypothetical protein
MYPFFEHSSKHGLMVWWFGGLAVIRKQLIMMVEYFGRAYMYGMRWKPFGGDPKGNIG